MDYRDLTKQAADAFDILAEAAQPRPGQILVIGCSTSEVMGARIGSASNQDAAYALMDGLLERARAAGLYLAVQGCEHINRALCVERACMERYDLTEVCVKPWLHAGGAFITAATERFDEPVMVEDLHGRASLGMDIGGTLIGMHMHPVVVPIHTDMKKLGEANLVMARTRPKFVGGQRAQYPDIQAPHEPKQQ